MHTYIHAYINTYKTKLPHKKEHDTFVFLSFSRLLLGKNSSARSARRLTGCPWTRRTWWRGTVKPGIPFSWAEGALAAFLPSETHCGFYQQLAHCSSGQEILSCALRSKHSSSLDLTKNNLSQRTVTFLSVRGSP